MAVVASESQIARALLTLEVQEFLYHEADLLDARRFAEWLELFAEDLRYFMPMRRNVGSAHPDLEMTREQQDVCWMDEGKATLAKRVTQLLTGVHWAEEPFSRVCHMVSNVRVLDATDSQVTVGCRFLVYRNRQTEDTELFVGRRTDVLRREGDQWRIARREILLDQNVLLANNLTVFF
jgi:3-phenylpropionate/cinnamic acid dioxygenase small subunit